ncbi:MAG: ImmA/IrrE family metallo-endopeptidase [Mesorhizobium sp.]|nr:MAG: ImmA/IrrE family metallo-endopeptidase [Mesorhizobium sp.]
MLDGVFGTDRFDHRPVDMRELALGYSSRNPSEEPIVLVEGRPLQGMAGTLFPSEDNPRRWAIAYDSGQSEGRRNFTIGHEFGHYVLHRDMLGPDGIRCEDDAVLYREGEGIENEADEFAAAILMPLHDFRRKIDPDAIPTFDDLAAMANRYGVSLTAATLRWLEYTNRRSILVVSNEGFAHWAKSSEPAFRSHRFIRTKNMVYELPTSSTAATGNHSDDAKRGIWRSEGTWFPEPALEMCVRSDRYDLEFTLLHLDPSDVSPLYDEEAEEDTYDRFVRSGHAKV